LAGRGGGVVLCGLVAQCGDVARRIGASGHGLVREVLVREVEVGWPEQRRVD
jgi:hypothetical protein